MDTFWTLYWFTRVDGLINLFVFVACVSGLAAFMFGLFSTMTYVEEASEYNKFKPLFNWTFASCLLAISSATFIPSQKDLAIMYGGQMVVDLAKSKEATETGRKVYELVNKELDKALAAGKK